MKTYLNVAKNDTGSNGSNASQEEWNWNLQGCLPPFLLGNDFFAAFTAIWWNYLAFTVAVARFGAWNRRRWNNWYDWGAWLNWWEIVVVVICKKEMGEFWLENFQKADTQPSHTLSHKCLQGSRAICDVILQQLKQVPNSKR